MYCYVVYVNGRKVVHVEGGGHHLSDDGPPHLFTFKELIRFLGADALDENNDKVEIVTVR